MSMLMYVALALGNMSVLLYVALALVLLLLLAIYMLFRFSQHLFSTVRSILPEEPPEARDAKRYVIVGAYDVPIDSPEVTMHQADANGCAVYAKGHGTHLLVRENAQGSTMRELSKVHPLLKITVLNGDVEQ